MINKNISYPSSTKQKKGKEYIKVIVLILVGLSFLAGGIVSLVITLKDKSEYKKTTGTICDIVEEIEWSDSDQEYISHYEVFVDYEVDGVKYSRVKYDYYISTMEIGDTVNVYYSTDNHKKIRSKASGSLVPSIIFIVISFIPIIFGIRTLIKNIKYDF